MNTTTNATDLASFDDVGNCSRFLAIHGDDVRFSPGLGWLIWSDGLWLRDDQGTVYAAAALIGDAIDAEADGLLDAAAEAEREELKKEAKRLRALAYAATKWATSSRMAPRIKAIVEIASRDPSVVIAADTLDADPWALGCTNGWVDLRTGKLYPHDRAKLLTRRAGCAYDPAATCPTWDRFLGEAQPDPEIRAFLARLVGYWSTGAIKDHLLPMLIGSGANGKGTFIETITAMLGGYARAVPARMWVASGDEHPTLYMQLRGVRFAPSQETKHGQALDTATLKTLTGGDRITARFMNRDFVTFMPSHKLVLATNERPIVCDTTDGTWRRFAPISWPVSFAGREDTGLIDALKSELPGILAWAMRGLADYIAGGIRLPASIIAARESYRATSDPVASFLTEQCVRDADAAITRAEVYGAYADWCQGTGGSDRGQGERPLGPRRFAERLRAEKFAEKAKVRFTVDPLKAAIKARDIGWGGLRLKTPAEKEAEADLLEAEEAALAALAAESRRTGGANDSSTVAA